MYTQKLLVHDRCKGQCAERVHARFVDLFRVLVFALKLECEIVCQMPAFVIPSEQPESVWVPYLERPEVQDALRKMSASVRLD